MKKGKYDIQEWLKSRQINLSPEEYATVMSEFNSHMSDMDRGRLLVTKPIGNYYYTIVNYGYNDYMVIGKCPINEAVEEMWEDM
ncbi:MAG: hypothetical protein J6O55_07280 [Lachnospiraceae bacterium]|nr:hypothetical protein [Lachnospiraceae bacterium]